MSAERSARIAMLGMAALAAVAGGVEAAGGPASGRSDACALLSKEEATQILGVRIERLESKPGPKESTCNYFVKPVAAEARQQDVAKRFLDIARGQPEPAAPPREGDATDVVRQTGLGDLVKSLGAATRGPNDPYLAIAVTWEGGRAGFTTLKLTIAAQSAGLKTTESLRGIGDDAFLGLLDSILMFVKGETAVSIGLANVPQARDKGIEMAKRVASRL